jgi:hypothetical protein
MRCGEFGEQFKGFTSMEPEFIFFALRVKAHIQKASEIFQIKLISNVIHQPQSKVSETKLHVYYSYLAKGKFPRLESIELRMTATFATCEQNHEE